ncbi:hypothetical protein HMPREF1146_1134 [Prevotella sp. MSX73]|nr:hypothetical protein HMPREF1146_1134 [Prevotella sp. MSX73]
MYSDTPNIYRPNRTFSNEYAFRYTCHPSKAVPITDYKRRQGCPAFLTLHAKNSTYSAKPIQIKKKLY